MTDATTQAPAPGTPPRADCVADAAGGITFDVAVHEATAPVLVLGRRGGTGGPADEVRLPLTPAGEGRARAVLPSTMELAEGRWDLFLDERAVEPGIRDVRSLVDRVPDEQGPLAVRIPYPTADGRLAVRSWLRAPHAEAGDIGLGDGTCTVEGVLYGAELGPGAVAEARLGDRVHQVPAGGGKGRFTFTLPYDDLARTPPPAGKQHLWELWLRPDEDAGPVRISRLLDDIWDRKSIHVYPVQRRGGYRAAPCYTTDNDLCVRLTA